MAKLNAEETGRLIGLLRDFTWAPSARFLIEGVWMERVHAPSGYHFIVESPDERSTRTTLENAIDMFLLYVDEGRTAADARVSTYPTLPRYPLTVCLDRYTGAYAGRPWLAFRLEAWDVPAAPFDDDVTASSYWGSEPVVGRGDTPEAAIADLEAHERLVTESDNFAVPA